MPQSPPDPAPTADPPRRPAVLELGRWVLLGAASGVLAGVACWAFLEALDWATDTRTANGWLVWLLPLAGLAVGFSYHRFGGRAGQGNALLLDEVHEPTEWMPRRMAPLVAVGTVVSQLFGASVGREGTALQMSGSLTDALARALRLDREDRRLLLTVALSGGFGAVFGVPWAGLVFGIEVQRTTWARRRSAWARLVVAAAVASFVGDRLVLALGYHHSALPELHVDPTAPLLLRSAAVGVACGILAIAFVEATDLVRALGRGLVRWDPGRPVLGGVVVLGLVALVGRDYLGLSLPLIGDALAGQHTPLSEPLLKLLFTAVCIGTGYVGGEVTPLFVMGTTLGSAVGSLIGLDPATGATVGFAAVFGGATNTPLACTVMGIELFGPGATLPVLAACAVAYACSGRRGIYPTQRITVDGQPLAVHEVPGLHHHVLTVGGRVARWAARKP